MKGSWVDLILLPWLLFGVAIVIIVSLLILQSLSGTAIDNGFISQAAGIMKAFDGLFIVIAIGLNLFVITSAFMVKSHPMLFALSVFFQLINVLMAEIASDVYANFATSAGLSTYASQYPLMALFFQHLPVFALIIGFIVALAMYAHGGGGSGDV